MTKIAKALIGAVVAGVGAIGTGILTAAQDNGITQSEWWIILGGTLVATSGAFGAVWATPNAQP